MAKSQYEYVKEYENDNILLKSTFIVIRIDGRGFTLFTKRHKFEKPNDIRALQLMNQSAICVMEKVADITLAYGQSDEYRETKLYRRRRDKLVSTVVSCFSSAYVYYWRKYFPTIELEEPPMFDGRAVMYPTEKSLRDYLSWRQADCHINNLYNTCFWALVQQGNLSNQEAQLRIKDTVSADKQEILFSEFGRNYNNEKAIYRKGSILIREPHERDCNRNVVLDWKLTTLHVDLIRTKPFWHARPWLLDSRKPARVYKEYKKVNVKEMIKVEEKN